MTQVSGAVVENRKATFGACFASLLSSASSIAASMISALHLFASPTGPSGQDAIQL